MQKLYCFASSSEGVLKFQVKVLPLDVRGGSGIFIWLDPFIEVMVVRFWLGEHIEDVGER